MNLPLNKILINLKIVFSKLVFTFLLLIFAEPSYAVSSEALSCLVNPSKVVNVASPVPGVVDELYIKKGDYLSKGQVILKLNSEIEKVSLRSAQVQVEFFKRKLHRNDELLKQKLVSELEQDELKIDLLQAELKMNEVESTLALKTLKSPLSGVVQKKMVEAGELVGQKPVLQILQLNPLYIEVIFPKAFYEQMNLGRHLSFVTSLGSKQQHFSGKVIVKDPIIDVASETFGVRVQVANPGYEIVAGQKCEVVGQ